MERNRRNARSHKRGRTGFAYSCVSSCEAVRRASKLSNRVIWALCVEIPQGRVSRWSDCIEGLKVELKVRGDRRSGSDVRASRKIQLNDTGNFGITVVNRRDRSSFETSRSELNDVSRGIGRYEREPSGKAIIKEKRGKREDERSRTLWLKDIKRDSGCASASLARLSGVTEPLSRTERNEVVSVGLHSSGQCSQESLQLSSTAELRGHESGIHGPDPLRPRDDPSCSQGLYIMANIRTEANTCESNASFTVSEYGSTSQKDAMTPVSVCSANVSPIFGSKNPLILLIRDHIQSQRETRNRKEKEIVALKIQRGLRSLEKESYRGGDHEKWGYEFQIWRIGNT
ncbi:hypothetical protein G5I_07917 [Acromyrmex echinatior]|uniref:Uncharacterized protein n=1 Tax=Acromyrmex echinatior TaxID=103372 RepID=F4WQ57_ACREC|nr:hypothetical protein G5I_07917 [Acromyrmex echinatior]